MKKEDIAQLLTRQIKEPVRFYESIAVMQEAGVNQLYRDWTGESFCQALSKKIVKRLN